MTLSEQLEQSELIISELKKYEFSAYQVRKIMNWIEDEDWRNYDGIDRWVKGRRVVETKTLIDIFYGRES